MEDYPRTLEEFEGRFVTEQACREYLMQLRWPRGFACPRCGGQRARPSVVAQSKCPLSRPIEMSPLDQDRGRPFALGADDSGAEGPVKGPRSQALRARP